MTRVASLLLVLSLFVIPHAALAADGVPIEVSGGYSYLHDQDASSNFPGGWTGSVSAALNSRLSVVGELGGSYQTPTTPSTGATSHIYSFLGGARYTAYSAGKVSIFGQALIGAARSSFSADSTVSPETDLAFQPGGGVDVTLAPKWAVRVQGDFRAVRVISGTNKQERFVAGLVFKP
jgi:Outer membrane protein beta-barrel domain